MYVCINQTEKLMSTAQTTTLIKKNMTGLLIYHVLKYEVSYALLGMIVCEYEVWQ